MPHFKTQYICNKFSKLLCGMYGLVVMLTLPTSTTMSLINKMAHNVLQNLSYLLINAKTEATQVLSLANMGSMKMIFKTTFLLPSSWILTLSNIDNLCKNNVKALGDKDLSRSSMSFISSRFLFKFSESSYLSKFEPTILNFSWVWVENPPL